MPHQAAYLDFIRILFIITLLTIEIYSQCPSEITCEGINKCYMVYAQSNDWYYYHNEPENARNVGGSPPSSASTYVLMRSNSFQMRSLTEIDRECQKAGANVATISSNDEYRQFTDNVLHILSYNEKVAFYVKVESLPMHSFTSTCAKITVKDTFFNTNEVSIFESECYEDQSVNSIVCEKTSPSAVIHCAETTTVKQTTKKATTPIVTSTSPITTTKYSKAPGMSTSQNIITNIIETTQLEETTSYVESEIQPINQNIQQFSDMFNYIIAAVSLALLIVIGLICLLVKRRRKKTKPSTTRISARNNVVTKGESNIYADGNQLLDQAAVSVNVANETVQIHLGCNAERELETKEQNVYDCMSYEKLENPEKQYSSPNQKTDVSECIYQEPDQFDGSLVQISQYDVPKYCYNEHNVYQEPKVGNVQYDTPKSHSTDCSDVVYQEPDAMKDYDSMSAKSTKSVTTKHVPVKEALKPPTVRSKSTQKYSVPSTYDIPHTNIKKDVKPLPKKELETVDKDNKYASMDKKPKEEQNYTAESANQYENYGGTVNENDKTELPNLNEHYDVPRKANEKGFTKKVKTKPADLLKHTEHYDVPRTPNEYETCDDNMNKQTQVSNALYESLGDDQEIKSKKQKKKSKNVPKPKPRSSKATKGYMSYDSQQPGGDEYQELDQSTTNAITLR